MLFIIIIVVTLTFNFPKILFLTFIKALSFIITLIIIIFGVEFNSLIKIIII